MSTWGLSKRTKPTLRSRAWFLLLLFFQRKVCPGPAAPCTGAGLEAGVSRAIQHPRVRVRLLPAARRVSRWHRGPRVSAGAGGEALHTHGRLGEEGEGREGEGPGLYTCPSFIMPTSLCFFDKNLQGEGRQKSHLCNCSTVPTCGSAQWMLENVGLGWMH